MFLRQTYKQKPQMWGPPSRVQYAIRHYFEQVLGVVSPSLAIPAWEGGGDTFAVGRHRVTRGAESSWHGNTLYCSGTTTGGSNAWALPSYDAWNSAGWDAISYFSKVKKEGSTSAEQSFLRASGSGQGVAFAIFQYSGKIRNIFATDGNTGWTSANDVTISAGIPFDTWCNYGMSYHRSGKRKTYFGEDSRINLEESLTGTEVTGGLIYVGGNHRAVILGSDSAGNSNFKGNMDVIYISEDVWPEKVFGLLSENPYGPLQPYTPVNYYFRWPFVNDLVEPKSIGSSGFATDGAIHIDLDGNKNAEFDNDILRHKQPLVIEDWPYQSGDPSSPTDYQTEHWDCEQGTTNIGSKTVTLSGASYVDDGVEILTTDTVRLPFDSNTFEHEEGTIYFEYEATGSPIDYDWFVGMTSDASTAHFIFRLGVSYLQIYHSGSNQLTSIGNSVLTDGVRHKVSVAYKTTSTSCEYWIVIDNKVEEHDSFTITRVAPTTNPLISVGCHNTATTRGIDGIIYDFKILNKPILPYGAYHTGYDQNSNYDSAHADILFYWDGSDCTSSNVQIGGVQGTLGSSGGSIITSGGYGSNDDYYDNEVAASSNYWMRFPITNRDIFDFRKGSMSFWLNVASYSSGSNYIFGARSGTDDVLSAYITDSSTMLFQYRIDSSSYNYDVDLGFSNVVAGWNWITLKWADSNNGGYIECYVNNILKDSDYTVNRVATAEPSYIYFGASFAGTVSADVHFDEVFITSSPLTPQIETANGVPLHAVQIEVE